jgi:hypothetical protein
MKNNSLKQLGTLGRSIWLDDIRRYLITDGWIFMPAIGRRIPEGDPELEVGQPRMKM